MKASVLATVFAQAGEFSAITLLGTLVLIFLVLIIFFWFIPVRLWIAALASGAHVGLFTLVAMRLRRVPPKSIVEPRISCVKAGLDVPLNFLEGHFLAGGNVQVVVNALISADKANIELSFTRAAAIDLAGRNVFEAVQMSVNVPSSIHIAQLREEFLELSDRLNLDAILEPVKA